MIQLPPGFDVMVFVSELFMAAVPFVTVAVMVTAFVIISKILKKV